MKINIECTYNKIAAKELSNFFLYKKTNKKYFIIIFFIIGFTLCIFNLHTVLEKDLDIKYLRSSLTLILIWVFVFIYYLLLPFIHYQLFGKLKNKKVGYEFYDKSFAFVSIDTEYIPKEEIQYSELSKIYETSKYLIVFRNRAKYLLLEKKSMNDSSFKTLKDKLKSISNVKYIECNY